MPGRVVHLTTVHQPRDNRIFNKEVRALAEAGIDVTLVVRSDQPVEDARCEVVTLPRPDGRISRVLRGQLDAWRALGRLRPALVHVHDPELVPLVWLWARTHRARCVYDAHEDLVAQIDTKSYLPGPAKPLVRALARALVGFADRGMDAIVAATESVADGYANPRRAVVRNYPWLQDFPAVDHRPVPGRVVYAGDLTEERRLSFMIAVIERTRVLHPAAHLVLAGRPLRGAQGVLDAAGAEPLEGSGPLRYVGLLPPAQVPALIAKAQVGLIFLEPLPNYLRSLPTKLFEYMGAGVPFLASDFPFWRAEFEGWQAGRFADSGDVDATAAVLAGMLDDPQGCEQMGANGRRAVEQGLSFESQAPALVELTRSLLDEPATAPRPTA